MNDTFNCYAFLIYLKIFPCYNFAVQFGPFPVPSKLTAAADGKASQPLIEAAHFHYSFVELP